MASSNDSEEDSLGDILDLFPSCPSSLKGHDIHSHTVLRSNVPMLSPAGAFNEDEDTSEPEEEEMLLIQELVLRRMDLL